METFEKTAYEAWKIWGDFAEILKGESESISSAVITAQDKSGNDVSTTVLKQDTKTIADSRTIILMRAGSISASPYKITFRAVTSLGYKWEIDAKLRVKNLVFDDDFTKQSYESFPIGAPLGRNMNGNETIESVTVTAIDRAGDDVSEIVIDQENISKENQTVVALIRDGEQSLSPYRITYRGVTSEGEQYEKGILLKIKEK